MMYSRIIVFLAFLLTLKYAYELIQAHQLLAGTDRKLKIPRGESGEIQVKLLKESIMNGELQHDQQAMRAVVLLRRADIDMIIIAVLIFAVLLREHVPAF